MKWYAWGKYAIVNFKYAAGDVDKVIRMKGYAISKAPHFEGGTIYTAWKLPSLMLGNFNNLDDAKRKVLQNSKEQ
jgi:hypothetical protein